MKKEIFLGLFVYYCVALFMLFCLDVVAIAHNELHLWNLLGYDAFLGLLAFFFILGPISGLAYGKDGGFTLKFWNIVLIIGTFLLLMFKSGPDL